MIFVKYSATFLLIALSGIPFFSTGPEPLIVVFILSTLIFIALNHGIDSYFLGILFSLIFLLMVQSWVFNFFSVITFFGTLLSFITAYFLIKIIGIEFIPIYSKIMYYLALISLIIFTALLLIPNLETSLIESLSPIFARGSSRRGYQYLPNIIIYTFNTGITSGIITEASVIGGRNPGPFWEAGGFGIFLNLAFLFNVINKKVLFSKENITLILAIISTISTGSYLVMFLIIALFTIYRTRNKAVSIIVLMFVIFYLIINLEFLGPKIQARFDQVQGRSVETLERRERFANFALDLIDFAEYPFTGRGVNEVTRFKDFSGFSAWTHRNSGISDFLVSYGMFFFIWYFIAVYFSFRTITGFANLINRNVAIFCVLIFFMLGASQVIFAKPLFIAFTYMFFIFNSEKKKYD